MPVVIETTVSYVLVRFAVNMEFMTATIALQKFVGSEPTGLIEFQVVGEELGVLLGSMPVAGKTRGDDITDLVYQYAIDLGLISGTIT